MTFTTLDRFQRESELTAAVPSARGKHVVLRTCADKTADGVLALAVSTQAWNGDALVRV